MVAPRGWCTPPWETGSACGGEGGGGARGGADWSTAAAAAHNVRSDMARFGKTCKLTAFKPFTSAANALEQINAVSESSLTDDLKNFLELNLPKVRRAPLMAPGADAWMHVVVVLEAAASQGAGWAAEEGSARATCASTHGPHGGGRMGRVWWCALAPDPDARCPAPPSSTHPQVKKDKAKFKLGVCDPKLGSAIQEATGLPCIANEMVGGRGRQTGGCAPHTYTCATHAEY